MSNITKIIVGVFLVGFIVGSCVMIVINRATGEQALCVCTQTQGGAKWSGSCPPELQNKYPDRCPQF